MDPAVPKRLPPVDTAPPDSFQGYWETVCAIYRKLDGLEKLVQEIANVVHMPLDFESEYEEE